jgi:hypothetical protein
VSDELSIPRHPVYRVNRSRGPDPMTRRLMIIAGGLSAALVLIVVAWSAVGHHSGPVPVIQADSKPVRVKPANPGGMQIAGLSSDTGSGDASSATDRLAPAPETPDPQALARQIPPPAPQAAAPSATAQVAAPIAPKLPAHAPAQPMTTAAAPAGVPSAPLSPTAVRPVTAAPPSGAPGAMAEHHAPPPASSALATATPYTSPSTGRTQVQLAALGTEAAAHQEWARLSHRMPSVFSAHHPVFSKIEHDGHTLWRVRTGGFTDEAQASQFCQEVRTKGGSCAVAAF